MKKKTKAVSGAPSRPKRRSHRGHPAPVGPRTIVQNCNFTGTPPTQATLDAATAIAHAAKANAEALSRAAEMLKGPDALLRIGHTP